MRRPEAAALHRGPADLCGAAAMIVTQSAAPAMSYVRGIQLQRPYTALSCFITALSLICNVVYRDPVDERPRSSSSAQRSSGSAQRSSSNEKDPERSPYSDMGQGPSSAEDFEEPLTSEEVTPRMNPYSSMKKERPPEPGLMDKVHVTQDLKS